MQSSESSGPGRREPPRRGSLWLAAGGCTLVILLGLLASRHRQGAPRTAEPGDSTFATTDSSPADVGPKRAFSPRSASAPSATPEQIVTARVAQFAGDRHRIAQAMAERLKIEVPADVEQFFGAAEAGQWDEAKRLLEELRQRRAEDRAVEKLWGPIAETFGVAEVAHDWPAQQLLDYGQAVLGSLRPGMVYVGGTDPGRFIPTLLDATSEGERHVILTQNAFADGTYLEYARFLYGDSIGALGAEDSQRAFTEYLAGAQRRLAHDQQFPDEPKQLRPGEDVRVSENRVQVSGQTAVMAINESLLNMLMDKNPGVSFALEESFPLRSTYGTAVPLGPIMELRAPDAQMAFSSERASEVLDYWQTTAQRLLNDPAAPEGSDPRKAWSKLATAQANLLADHSYAQQAEAAYRLAAQLEPTNPDAIWGLGQLLARAGRGEEATRLLTDFARTHPNEATGPEWRGSLTAPVQPQQ